MLCSRTGWPPVSLSLLDVVQDLDEVFQAEDVARVRSVIGAALIPGALVRCVSEVDHPDVNFGEASGAALGRRLQSLLWVRAARGSFRRLLPVVDDQEGAGVEAVRTLAPDDREQGLQLALDGPQQLRPEAGPVVQELIEGLSEPIDGELPPIVLVFAEKVLLVRLINLMSRKRKRKRDNYKQKIAPAQRSITS